ncbi:MAG: hypothetical protein ACKVTZ_14760 [Bacteroidia bacterium]
MPRSLTTRARKLRSIAARRRQSLKVAPKSFGIRNTWEKQNKKVLDSIEAKMKAAGM